MAELCDAAAGSLDDIAVEQFVIELTRQGLVDIRATGERSS